MNKDKDKDKIKQITVKIPFKMLIQLNETYKVASKKNWNLQTAEMVRYAIDYFNKNYKTND